MIAGSGGGGILSKVQYEEGACKVAREGCSLAGASGWKFSASLALRAGKLVPRWHVGLVS